ncbi:MAG: hypothetical protein AB3N18_04535 [Allomuricauda sp.]
MHNRRKEIPYGEDTERAFEKAGVRLKSETITYGKGMKYSRKKKKILLAFKEGHDLLQYSIVVKPYIKKKFRIEKDVELDIILYLYPIQFFTVKDYNYMPLREMGYTVPVMIDKNYLRVFIDPKGSAKVLTLTEHAIKIVRAYYSYLSGEKTVSNNKFTNPFLNEEAGKIDKQRNRLMEKLKTQTNTQANKFRRDLFL